MATSVTLPFSSTTLTLLAGVAQDLTVNTRGCGRLTLVFDPGPGVVDLVQVFRSAYHGGVEVEDVATGAALAAKLGAGTNTDVTASDNVAGEWRVHVTSSAGATLLCDGVGTP